ncbi:hypothetical protein C0558_00405 [Serratia marcescens]|uniref:hypothetical protein n=2 Tax=Bacteria TaxID=2 RepID=UPI000CA2266B|nr:MULTISPECIES: hypothetical protein [Serratia]AUO00323.1 hypothetical protein C0558_00405 [Serratia marcescens]BEN59712.1 hypothetical protein SMKC069_24030 [Serratia marcescens]HEI9782148.1 hypothetical protein [Serratia marcescens]
MPNYRLPWEFTPQLSEERLTIVAKELLKVLDQTFELLSTSLDDNYTRGTCTFGRQKNRVIELCMEGGYSWLKLTNPGMDVTFEIEGVPIRFFADDPVNPKKPGFFRRNQVDQLFAPVDTIPTVWRFVVEKPEFEGEGARIHFVGFNQLEEVLSLWTYGDERTTVLHSTDDTPPKPVSIELDDISPSVPDKSADKKLNNG